MERQTKPANEILDFKQANPRWWREIHRNENWTRELRGAIAIFLKKKPQKTQAEFKTFERTPSKGGFQFQLDE